MDPADHTTRRHLFVLAGVHFFFFLLLFSPWEGRGFDEPFYYAYLSSPLFDGDLDVLNDYYLSNNDFAAITHACSLLGPKGLVVNQFAAGSALLWFPFYVPARLAGWTAGLLRAPPPAWAADRYAGPYLLMLALATFTYGFLTLVLIHATCAMEYRPTVALWASLGAVFASPLTVYIFHDAAMAHGPSAFSVALLVYLSVRHREFRERSSYAVIGAALGLATLVRWQNAIFALIPAALWLARMRQADRPRPLRGELGSAMLGLAMFLALFSLQAVCWWTQRGTFLTLPQGTGFMQWARPRIYDVLFSGWNGLYYWHPLLALATGGLLVYLWQTSHKLPAAAALVCFALMVYINGAALDWFAGSSFGARRFCSSTPLLALGLAAVWSVFRGRARVVPALLTTLAIFGNVLLHLAFTRDMIDTFFVRELWFLRRDLLTQFPQWVQAIHLNSLPCVYLLGGEYAKAGALIVAAACLVGGILALALRGHFGFLERQSGVVLSALAGVVLLLDLALVLASPARNSAGVLLARVARAGPSFPEEKKASVLAELMRSGYRNPLVYSLALETLGERAPLRDYLNDVYQLSPALCARWVQSLPPGRVGAGDRRRAAELTCPPFLTLDAVYFDRGTGRDEERALRRMLRFNPFDRAALRRLAELAAREGRLAEAAELRSRLRRFLEAKVETFFAVERRLAPFTQTVFQAYYLDYATELAALYEQSAQPQAAASLRERTARFAPQP